MSNFSKISGSPTSIPISTSSTPPQKALPKIPEPKTSDPGVTSTDSKTPSKDFSLAKELTSPVVLQEVTENDSTPSEIQETAQELTGLKTELALSIGLTPKTTVNTDGPPRMNDENILDTLSSHFSESVHNAFDDFSQVGEKLIKSVTAKELATESMVHGHDQIELVVKSLDETLKGLDKKKEKYNAPLYRLADKLGFKNRTLKLKMVAQQRNAAIQSANASVIQLNELMIQPNLSSASQLGKLGLLSEQMQGSITQAKSDGKAFVETNKDNKGLMWSLGLKSKGQLSELVAKSLISGLPNGEQLLNKYDSLQQDHAQHKEQFNELFAHMVLQNQRIDDFISLRKPFATHAPIGNESKIEKMAREKKEQIFSAMTDEFKAEQKILSEKLLPLAKELGIPGLMKTLKDGTEELNFNFSQDNPTGIYPLDPPDMLAVLSPEQQSFARSMADGIQEAMPNRILDQDSIEVNGQKYINKTKLGQATMAVVYTYEHPETGQKIVVKEPLSSGLSEKEFQEKILDESVRELENHYHAMGLEGGGDSHLVSMIGSISTEQGPLVVMELIDGGDCQDLLEKMSDRVESMDLTSEDSQTIKKNMFYQMMQGLQYMHDRGMSHLDVKYDNFLISSEGTVKVADFGMSKTSTQFLAHDSEINDNHHLKPPEAFQSVLELSTDGGEITNKFDSWSVGAMMHQQLLGTRHRLYNTFGSKTEAMAIEFRSDFNNRMIENPSTPTEHLINGLMHPDPSQRLSLSEAMQSPVFDDIFENGSDGLRENVKQSVKDLIAQELAV